MSITFGAMLLGVSAAAGSSFYGIPLWRRRMAEASLRSRCTRERLIVLTYDDGPTRALTPRLLDLLGRFEVTATFFPKGVAAIGEQDLMDQLAEAGHEIGCHSQDHRHAWKALPPVCLRDALAGYETLSPWVPPDGLYRPPYGKIDLLTWTCLSRRGVEQAWWTIDSGDTWADLPRVEATVERVHEAGGGVVLMHDMHRDPARQRFVLELTERLLEDVATGTFVCRPFGALLDRPAAPTGKTDVTRSRSR